jgi:glycosyltransferase involved in cell wall biosynthesis
MISVVMPVYNGEKYLNEAIESILNQTYRDFEFIIINDGSQDNTQMIIEEYANNDPRIRIISRENRGLIASLNQGLENAHGKFIARMDADDISEPNRFELQLDLMERTNLDICGCHYFWINTAGDYIRTSIVPLEPKSFLNCLALTVPFAHPSVMIRKQFLLDTKLKYGQEKYQNIEDYSLWVECWNHNAQMGNVDKFLIRYRSYPDSLSNKNSKRLTEETKLLQKKFISRYKKEILTSFKNTNFALLPEDEALRIALLCWIFLTKHFHLSMILVMKKISTKAKIIALLRFLSNKY